MPKESMAFYYVQCCFRSKQWPQNWFNKTSPPLCILYVFTRMLVTNPKSRTQVQYVHVAANQVVYKYIRKHCDKCGKLICVNIVSLLTSFHVLASHWQLNTYTVQLYIFTKLFLVTCDHPPIDEVSKVIIFLFSE